MVNGSLKQRLTLSLSTAAEPRRELLLFRMLCVVTAAVSFFVIIPSILLHHLSAGINLAVFLFGVGGLVLYLEGCLGRYHLTVFFLLSIVVMDAVWFANDGSRGSIGFCFFCLCTYAMVFFRGRMRWLMLGVVLACLVGLLELEQDFPQWVIHYRSEADRMADLTVGMLVSALFCSLMLWSVLTGYDVEQRHLRKLNEELELNMERCTEVEKSLRCSQELLNAIFEGSSDAIYAKDTLGRYLVFNRAAAMMTGKSAGEALGSDDTALFTEQQARLFMLHDRQVLADGLTVTYEQVLHTATGEKVVLGTKAPLHDEQGRVVGVFGISHDVTESRRLAEELHKLTDGLEQQVRERTALLEAAVREQESFSYSVSHDLRGPLRHINSYTAILEEEFGAGLPEEAKVYLERVRSASSQMGCLIDDLLELSRIGRSELYKVPVNLSELAGSVTYSLQETEPGRRVEFEIRPGLRVKGDRVLLRQLLENLLGNAWKYSRRRECARIELGKSRVGDRDVFFVKDNGVGFDMNYKDRLFGPFQRLHGSEFEGSGIGLATVKRIVERHGGCVWAEAVVEQGATVFFTLA